MRRYPSLLAPKHGSAPIAPGLSGRRWASGYARCRLRRVDALHPHVEQLAVAGLVLVPVAVGPDPQRIPGGLRSGDEIGREHGEALVFGRDLEDAHAVG